MGKEEALRSIVRQDQEDREAYSGDLDLPPWSLSKQVYEEQNADILVAKITLGSTIRWLGISKLWESGALKTSWDALFEACAKRGLDGCRYWQREVSQRRSAFFGEDGPPQCGVPRRPVPPRRSNGNTN